MTSSVLGVSGCMQVRTLRGYMLAMSHYSHPFTRADLAVRDLICDCLKLNESRSKTLIKLCQHQLLQSHKVHRCAGAIGYCDQHNLNLKPTIFVFNRDILFSIGVVPIMCIRKKKEKELLSY